MTARRPAPPWKTCHPFFPDSLPTLKEAEQALITEAMQRADGNQGIAAGMLGLTRQALNKRLTRQKSPDPVEP